MTPRRGIRHRALVRFFAATVALLAAAAPPDDAQATKAAARPPTKASEKPASVPVPAAKVAPPLVVSKAKLKEQSRGSDFLRTPGADRYDLDAVDWAEVPPWRQTSFFGVRARGQFFVYVVDCSGSMIDEFRLARAKEEIRRAVAGLQEPQKFLVIFYNDQPIPMLGGLPRPAGLNSREQLLAWLRLIEPDGETDPRGALGMALSLRPDAVFLLSDGEFPDGTVESIAAKNTRKTPIHCIDLSGVGTGDQLKRIAADSGGRYAWRPWMGGP